MRLGEILVDDGALTDDQVAQALVLQRTSRQRLGAALVELGHATDDDIARALARQHGVPAALDRHLAQRDDTLVTVLPIALAVGIAAVPVAWARGRAGLSLVVCFRDPWPEHVAEVEHATGYPVIPAVAGERAIQRALDRAYAAPAAAAVPDGVPDQDAAVDVDFDDASQPRLALDLVGLDDGRVQRDATQAAPPQRIAPAPAASAIGLDAALTAIATADTPDRIADLAIAYAHGAWRGAALLNVREGLAVGHRGFGGNLTAAALEALAIPLAQPSVLATVHDRRRAFAGEPPPGGLVQARFLKLFAGLGARPIAVVPVAIGDRVVSLLFAIGPLGPLIERAAALGRLAVAMETAYARLIRAARAART